MSDNLTALASENLNPSLRSLLEDVQRGHIRVPRFQRPFVWTDKQRLELLQSIRDNMPIGSLLVWRTTRFKLASFPGVGPHAIPEISEAAPAIGWQYLLDGHQRVSTLLGLLLQAASGPVADAQEEDDIDWNIQYDLMEQEFVFESVAERLKSARPLLPLWTLFDGRHVNRHMRDIRKRALTERWTDENLEVWETRADQLSYRFQQCRIPIVVMVTDDLDLAARTFQRVNSLGTPMGEAHLVAALTWTSDFDLRERISALRAALPAGWRKLDEGIFLQVCKGLVDLDMTKSAQSELVKTLKESPLLLDTAGRRISQVTTWLTVNAGVMDSGLLPYAFQLVLMAVELEKFNRSLFPGDAFLSWFWRTSWSEVFASATHRQVKAEQNELRNLLAGQQSSAWSRSPLPERFDFRSARARLLLIRLAIRESSPTAAGSFRPGAELLSAHGRESLVRLFLAPRRASASLKWLVQGAGNRFFIDPATDENLRERLRIGPDLPRDALDAHFVTPVALDVLRSGDLESFLRIRTATIQSWDEAQWKIAVEASLDFG